MCSYSHLTKVNHYRTSGLWLYTSYLQLFIALYEHTERKNVHFCGNLFIGHIYDANYPYLYSHKSWRMIPYSVFAAGIKCNGEHDWLKTFRLFLLGTLYNFQTFDIYFWSIWNKKKIFDINGENKFFCNLCRVFSLNWSASVLHV